MLPLDASTSPPTYRAAFLCALRHQSHNHRLTLYLFLSALKVSSVGSVLVLSYLEDTVRGFKYNLRCVWVLSSDLQRCFSCTAMQPDLALKRSE